MKLTTYSSIRTPSTIFFDKKYPVAQKWLTILVISRSQNGSHLCDSFRAVKKFPPAIFAALFRAPGGRTPTS